MLVEVVVENGKWVNSDVVKYVEVAFESIKNMLSTQSDSNAAKPNKGNKKTNMVKNMVISIRRCYTIDKSIKNIFDFLFIDNMHT